mgnify:CR=1 FL=1
MYCPFAPLAINALRGQQYYCRVNFTRWKFRREVASEWIASKLDNSCSFTIEWRWRDSDYASSTMSFVTGISDLSRMRVAYAQKGPPSKNRQTSRRLLKIVRRISGPRLRIQDDWRIWKTFEKLSLIIGRSCTNHRSKVLRHFFIFNVEYFNVDDTYYF